MNDWELLEQFKTSRCERAFGDLVARHVGFVHATCRRRVRDAHLADDVTQAVFTVLARRPPVQHAGVSLSAWLYQTAIYACNNAMRSQRHRVRHEGQAMQQRERVESNTTPAISTEVEAQLDEAMSALSPGDRDVLLLKYYEGRDLREIGAALGLSETAASKRATRALDRLRTAFARHGHAVSAVALSEVLRQPATTELVARTASAALSGAAGTVVESITQGVTRTMSNVKTKLVAAMAAVAVVVLGGATLSLPLVFASASSAPQEKTSTPATQPVAATDAKADAPIDLSTPKGALRAFAKATRAADYDTLARVSKTDAPDDLEAKMIEASNAYQKSFSELSSSVRTKFGDEEWRKFMRQRGAIPLEPFLRLIEAELEEHEAVVEGETAKLVDKRNPKVETNIRLAREGGAWKVTSSGLVAQFGEEKSGQRIDMLMHRAEIVSEVAADVTAGKYANVEAAGNGLRDALRR